jgi:hypothetical protein
MEWTYGQSAWRGWPSWPRTSPPCSGRIGYRGADPALRCSARRGSARAGRARPGGAGPGWTRSGRAARGSGSPGSGAGLHRRALRTPTSRCGASAVRGPWRWLERERTVCLRLSRYRMAAGAWRASASVRGLGSRRLAGRWCWVPASWWVAAWCRVPAWRAMPVWWRGRPWGGAASGTRSCACAAGPHPSPTPARLLRSGAPGAYPKGVWSTGDPDVRQRPDHRRGDLPHRAAGR